MAEDDNHAHQTDDLVVELYDELKRIARRELRRNRRPLTLQTTALVSEAYLKLKARRDWSDKSHFLACASIAMRHLMVDAARARLTAKRDGGVVQPLEEAELALPVEIEDEELLRLSDALEVLARQDPNLARVVDLRFFVGLSEFETAEALGVTDRTVRRWWTQARAWIHAEMESP